MRSPEEEVVVVTGMGVVSPVGSSVAHHWQGLLAGKSGLVAHDFSALSAVSGRAVGLVRDEQDQLDAILDKKTQQRTDRFVHLGLIAAHQALAEADLVDADPTLKERVGVCVGVGIGGLQTIGESYWAMRSDSPRRVSPLAIPRTINNILPSWISIVWGLQGGVSAVTSACASGADAIGHAMRLVRHGYADIMVAGGAESCVNELALSAFGNMRTLSTWEGDVAHASRPFDARRTGFVLAEGAGMLVLERESHARKRGATIYGRLLGYGSAADANHITAMCEDGRGARQAMTRALDDAGLRSDQIDYINAHGTGTLMNDAVESQAIQAIFAARACSNATDRVLVSATKAATGHMIGAAGAVEAVTSLLALQHHQVPPTISLDESAGVAPLDYVPHHARAHAVRYAMSNSFGFGGSNAVLVMGR